MDWQQLRARPRYEFDKSMAAGPIALIGWLTLVSLAVILLATIVLAATGIAPEGDESLGFVEAFWASLMRTIDAGTLGGDNGWPFRIVMFFVTVAGIFVFSALIGVLSAGLEAKLEELRKGRSKVLEADHTIIYNWSSSIFDVISELTIANESRERPRIVVLADKDKVEMEDEIADKLDDLKNTRIICRSGDPTDLFDIALANPDTARSIVILAPEIDDPDPNVIKTILALTNGPDRKAEPYSIAAEIRASESADIARVVGGKEVQLVLADDLIARIVVQSTRQPGLSAVYTELLDFEGCEIYVVDQPELVGKAFGEAVRDYATATLIGLCDAAGTVALNPDPRRTIAEGDKVILIAEDDDAIRLLPSTNSAPPEVAPQPPGEALRAERTLLFGWNRRAAMIAVELSRYVGPGSVLTIAADLPDLADEIAAIQLASDRLRIDFVPTNTADAAAIAALDPLGYDQILVLGYSDAMAAQNADTRTLVTLLHLRRLAEAAGEQPAIVSEMIDVRNRELARVTRVEDFVVSNKLVSLMLAQASENAHLEAIFNDLLDEEGSEICLKPVSDYATPGEETNFYAVVEAATRRHEVAIGHHRKGTTDLSGRGMGGIVINPDKTDAITYAPEDRIIVLARS